MKSETLHVHGAFGRTFLLTAILFILLYGIGEWIARQETFRSYLTPVRFGSRHSQLGYKLSLLEAAQQKGSIDCIAIGSSTVDVGFDPDAFEKGYHEITGRDIRCFNFGIDASSSISAAAIARILVEDHHPRLLIFGTDARDYVVVPEDRDTAVVLDTPWVQYRQGHFSLEGWLQENSYFYRYRQHLARLARLNFEGTLRTHTRLSSKLRPNGYNPTFKTAIYINDPPDPEDESYEVVYYRRIYSSYQVRDENVLALEKIIDYKKAGTRVIIVEMPIADGLYYFFGNGEADYYKFVSRVEEVTVRHETPFWQTEPLDSIPDNGWSDYSHLNAAGAEIFSLWLGQQVGETDGQQPPLPPSPKRYSAR